MSKKSKAGLLAIFGILIFCFIVLPSEAEASDFISTWDTVATSTGSSNSNQIKLPLPSTGTYNFIVDWGDNSTSTITSYNQAEVTHTYASSGVYTLTISGTIIGWSFNASGDKLKIKDISQWGVLRLGNSEAYFYGCANLKITATDILDLTGTTSFKNAFRDSGIDTVPSMNSWDTSNVTTMYMMFFGATTFNQNIGSWNTGNVTTMFQMFYSANAFNQNIGSWNTSKVTSMGRMFESATIGSFNNGGSGSIGNWDTSNVTIMGQMFQRSAFNQNIGSWNTSKVTAMNSMFYRADNFDQNLGSWNVSSTTEMGNMFYGITLSPINYSNILVGWSAQSLKNGVVFNGGNSQYYTGAPATAKANIISTYGWTITDGGSISDTTPPTITSIASSTTDSTATITWTTNELATSTINYGLTTGYGTASSSAVATTSHSFTLTGLATSTTYHFQISSWDAVGNLATSSDYTFTTTYTPPEELDTTPPNITSIASSTTDTTATITWTTNELATSTLNFGTTTGYGTASSSAVATTTHSFTLTGLATSTTYHFQISSWDAVGNFATSSDYTFVTTYTPPAPGGTYRYPIGIPQAWIEPDVAQPARPESWTTEIPGYYYVDYTTGDLGRTYGFPGAPRKTIPSPIPAGSRVEVNGSYSPTTGGWFITFNGDGGTWVPNVSGPAWLIGTVGNRASFSGSVTLKGQYGIVDYIDNFGSHKSMGINSRTTGLGRTGHHFLVRNIELMGTNSATDSGGFSINGNTDEGGAGEDIIFYNNEVHHFGLTDPDGSDPDFIAVFVSTDCHRIWVLDNRLHDMSGSAMQITASVTGPITTTHVYGGRNEVYNLWATGMASKSAQYVVYSENHIYNIKESTQTTANAKGLAFQYDATDIWLLFNRIHDCSDGIKVASAGGENIYMIGNLIYDIENPAYLTFDGDDGYGPGGISIWGITNHYLINNTLYNVPNGIITPAAKLIFMENNIISNINEVDGRHFYAPMSGVGKDLRFYNNLFYQNGTIKVYVPGEPVMNVTTLNASTYGEGNLEGDPLFNDIGNIDFSISTSSPARDSGLASSSLQVDVYDRFFDTFGVSIEKDLNNESRPQGSAWDIGAYEYMDTGPDIIHPNITSIASSTDDSTATITWTTNELATSTINYGLTTGYGTALSSATARTSHSFTLTGLATSTTYHFQISSWDAAGNLATSSDYIFTTTYTPPEAPDTTPPTITSIASSTDDSTATITWTTNELATSTLNYGTTTGYGTASSSAVATTTHSFTLTGLATSTTYHFQVSSWDAVGNLATSGDYTFTTTYTPPAPETPVTPAVITVTSHSGGGSGGGGRGTSLSVNTNGMSTSTLIVELKKQLLVLLKELLFTLIEELKRVQAV